MGECGIGWRESAWVSVVRRAGWLDADSRGMQAARFGGATGGSSRKCVQSRCVQAPARRSCPRFHEEPPSATMGDAPPVRSAPPWAEPHRSIGPIGPLGESCDLPKPSAQIPRAASGSSLPTHTLPTPLCRQDARTERPTSSAARSPRGTVHVFEGALRVKKVRRSTVARRMQRSHGVPT